MNLARAFGTEVAIASSALPGLKAFFSPGGRGPRSYVHGSKIALVATIVGISLVPDAVLFWLLLPHTLWWLAAALDVLDVWACFWLWGIYGTMVRSPHELSETQIVFHNGILHRVELAPDIIVATRAIGAVRRRDVPRSPGESVAVLSFGGVPLVEVEFDPPALETHVWRRGRRHVGRAFVASDAPEALCAELRRLTPFVTVPVPSGGSGSR